MAAPAPAPGPAIPAHVQYWFNYRDLFIQANQQFGHILNLLAANNNTFPPFDPPLLTYPNSVNCRYNGPGLIADERGRNPAHPRPQGVGVLVGLWLPQGRDLPRGNAVWDPIEWCVVYGKVVKTGRPAKYRVMYFVRRLTFLGDGSWNPQNLPRTQQIALRDVFRIQACQGLNDRAMLAYVRQALRRARLAANNTPEALAQFNHMRDMQRAHLSLMPNTPRRDRQRIAFGLP
jgi:hypothetical protein